MPADLPCFGTGATGFSFTDANGVVRPAPLQSRAGAGVLSLFPFPNNPTGIYGANTFTRTLPASGFGKVISGMNIVKAIEASRTDSNDRPSQEVEITRTQVVPVKGIFNIEQ